MARRGPSRGCARDAPREGSFGASVEVTYQRQVVWWGGEVEVNERELREYADRSCSEGAADGSAWYLLLALVAAIPVALAWIDVRSHRPRLAAVLDSAWRWRIKSKPW